MYTNLEPKGFHVNEDKQNLNSHRFYFCALSCVSTFLPKKKTCCHILV